MNRTVLGKHVKLALAISIAGVALAACGGKDKGSVSVADAGSVGFALSLPSGATVDTVNYTLTGPNGYSKMGSFSVAGPGTTFTHTLPGIPAGMGYQITLSATSSDGRPCVGSSMMFAVVARQSVNVAVVLSCEGRGTSGSITIDGKLNICPVADSAIANPAMAAVGSTIALSGQGSDEDTGPAALTYAWTATGTAGTISGADSANATFTCNAQGTSTVTLTVSDSDTQCTGNTLTVDVTCGMGGTTGGAGASGAGAGGAGAGGAGAGGAGAGGAGAGGAGAGGAGAGGAGAGGAGAGGAGAGGAGAGGTGGSTGGACEACELANPTCGPRYNDCGAITGEINGMPKSTICRNIVECVRTTKCASDSATDSPSDCLCGLDIDVGVCSTMQLTALTGECKDLIALGAETTAVLDISTRLGDPVYATGLAMRLIQCDQRFCPTECSF